MPYKICLGCKARGCDRIFDPAGNGKDIVTHRVESITTDENGSLAWVTKGDANNVKDNAVVPAKIWPVYTAGGSRDWEMQWSLCRRQKE